MRALLLLTVVLFAAQVICAPTRVERLPLTHAELHDLEAQAREAHPDTTLTARDLHPATPVLLAHLDESTSGTMPAFIVEREVATAMLETEDDVDDMDVSAETEMDDETQTLDDGTALIESDFEISAPYGGYGGYGGFGGYGGGKKGFGYGSKKVPYKKVPFKKVPLKKKAPPKKKLPPKKFPPKKKGGFGFGGYGFGGGFGGHH